MPARIHAALGALCCAFVLQGAVQDKQPTTRQVVGHVYRPPALEPTDARLRDLQLPPGFRIERYAGLLKPRILAVGEGGAVYASQPDPGQVTLLKDTDGDGVADVQEIVEDPDAASPKPFVHWLAANLRPTRAALPAKVPKTEKPPALNGGIQGGNTTGALGYFGPRPPAGEPPHRYHFQVFALDTPLNLPSGFNRDALLNAMRGHVLARGELVGTYAHDPAEILEQRDRP